MGTRFHGKRHNEDMVLVRLQGQEDEIGYIPVTDVMMDDDLVAESEYDRRQRIVRDFWEHPMCRVVEVFLMLMSPVFLRVLIAQVS